MKNLMILAALVWACRTTPTQSSSSKENLEAELEGDTEPLRVIPHTGNFYWIPGVTETPDCVQYTHVHLTRTKVVLTDRLDGVCQIQIEPNERTYTVNNVSDAECGSRRYNGVSALGAIEIIDHRLHNCRELLAHFMMITETLKNGQEVRRYNQAEK